MKELEELSVEYPGGDVVGLERRVGVIVTVVMVRYLGVLVGLLSVLNLMGNMTFTMPVVELLLLEGWMGMKLAERG